MDCSLPGCSVHGDSPGKNTGVGCHAFHQGMAQEYWSGKPIPFKVITNIEIASQVALVVKNQTANADVERRGFDPWVRKIL